MTEPRPRILFVEDDASLREMTALGLTRKGFDVVSEADGETGLRRALDETYEAIVLDVVLPGLDGYQVCRAIREQSQAPILMLTGKSDPVDVVVGLEAGADDYLKKPFDMGELVARLRSLLRRASVHNDHVLSGGGIKIDLGSFRVTRQDDEIDLTTTEYKLLVELLRNSPDVLSRADLLARVWNYEFLGDSRLVDMAVKRLRNKIEEDPAEPRLIKTVRGVGYRFDGG